MKTRMMDKFLSKVTGAFILSFISILPLTAQNRDQQIRAHIDSILTARYYKTPYDTNYVVRPEGKLTLKVMRNQMGNDFHARGTMNGVYAKADLKTSYKSTVSIGASYRSLSASLSINPAKWRGAYKDYEFNFNYYSNRISLDFSYQKSESLTGDINRDDTGIQTMQSGDLTMTVVNLAGYYAFNYRRFSFPAAFNQRYIQLRSVGSWLAGISYQGGSIETSDELKARKPEAPEIGINVGHIGIGGGYGYNWVIGKRWLLHFSMLPTFVVYNRNKMTVNGERKEAQRMRFNMIFNERAAIIYQFTPHYFAGGTLNMNNSVFDDKVVIVNQNKWVARVFVGMRL